MALIPILGVPSDFRLPGSFLELVPAQGPSTASAGTREVVFVMPMAASGTTWTVNTRNRVRTEQDAIDGAAEGSNIHRAIRKYLSANKNSKVFAVPYLPSDGMGVASADLDITIAGSPSATGVASITIAGELLTFGFKVTDTPTTIMDGFTEIVTARKFLPVTASNVAGVLTLVAKTAGISGGDGTIGTIRVYVDITAGAGLTLDTENGGITDALGLGTAVAGVDGATTEAANFAAALAVLDSVRKYYVVSSVFDAVAIGSLVTHVAGKSEPRPGLRSVGIVAFTHTLGAVQTLATAQNEWRLHVVWQQDSDHTPDELAGNLAAVMQKYEQVDPGFNFDNYRRASDWKISAAFDPAKWPDDTDLNDAINDGIIGIASDDIGSQIVMMVNTRSKDASGANDDFRATESHRRSITDDFADAWAIRDQNQFGGKKLQSDELLADGTVNFNQRQGVTVIKPSSYRPFMVDMIDEWEERDLLQETAASKEGLRVVRDPNNTGRLEIGLDLRTTDLAHQRTARFAEVTPG